MSTRKLPCALDLVRKMELFCDSVTGSQTQSSIRELVQLAPSHESRRDTWDAEFLQVLNLKNSCEEAFAASPRTLIRGCTERAVFLLCKRSANPKACASAKTPVRIRGCWTIACMISQTPNCFQGHWRRQDSHSLAGVAVRSWTGATRNTCVTAKPIWGCWSIHPAMHVWVPQQPMATSIKLDCNVPDILTLLVKAQPCRRGLSCRKKALVIRKSDTVDNKRCSTDG